MNLIPSPVTASLDEPLPMPDHSASTLVAERAETAPGDGDHEKFAHFVPKEKIVESAVTGMPVIALCGKVWVPTRDPSRFPVCPDCQRIYDGLPEGDGSDDGGDF